MKKLCYLSFVLLITVLSSCSADKFFANGISGNDLTHLQLFEPVSAIGIYDKGNKWQPNDSLSEIAKELIIGELKYEPKLDIAETIIFDDSILNDRLQKEIEYMMFWAGNKDFRNIKLTPTIDSILDAENERFGLLALSTGFTRTTENYAAQIAKGIGIGILTLGTAVPVPYKEGSTLYLMVVDALNDNIAFFKPSGQQELSPIEAYTYQRHLKKLLKRYK